MAPTHSAIAITHRQLARLLELWEKNKLLMLYERQVITLLTVKLRTLLKLLISTGSWLVRWRCRRRNTQSGHLMKTHLSLSFVGGSGMKWEEISKQLSHRSADSCRLHYQSLERRSEWDEESKDKLAAPGSVSAAGTSLLVAATDVPIEHHQLLVYPTSGCISLLRHVRNLISATFSRGDLCFTNWSYLLLPRVYLISVLALGFPEESS